MAAHLSKPVGMPGTLAHRRALGYRPQGHARIWKSRRSIPIVGLEVDRHFRAALVLAHETEHRIGAIRQLRWSVRQVRHAIAAEGGSPMAGTTGTPGVKLIAIGNSRGIRIPKVLREKYGWSESILLEETEEGLLLGRDAGDKLSWKETYKAMAAADEDWSDLDVAMADGLD